MLCIYILSCIYTIHIYLYPNKITSLAYDSHATLDNTLYRWIRIYIHIYIYINTYIQVHMHIYIRILTYIKIYLDQVSFKRVICLYFMLHQLPYRSSSSLYFIFAYLLNRSNPYELPGLNFLDRLQGSLILFTILPLRSSILFNIRIYKYIGIHI